jgi:hypothetical protein
MAGLTGGRLTTSDHKSLDGAAVALLQRSPLRRVHRKGVAMSMIFPLMDGGLAAPLCPVANG